MATLPNGHSSAHRCRSPRSAAAAHAYSNSLLIQERTPPLCLAGVVACLTGRSSAILGRTAPPLAGAGFAISGGGAGERTLTAFRGGSWLFAPASRSSWASETSAKKSGFSARQAATGPVGEGRGGSGRGSNSPLFVTRPIEPGTRVFACDRKVSTQVADGPRTSQRSSLPGDSASHRLTARRRLMSLPPLPMSLPLLPVGTTSSPRAGFKSSRIASSQARAFAPKIVATPSSTQTWEISCRASTARWFTLCTPIRTDSRGASASAINALRARPAASFSGEVMLTVASRRPTKSVTSSADSNCALRRWTSEATRTGKSIRGETG